MLKRISNSTESFFSVTAGEYLFDQWDGDWRLAVGSYVPMLDKGAAEEVAMDLKWIFDLPDSMREDIINPYLAIDFQSAGASLEQYLLYALDALSRKHAN